MSSKFQLVELFERIDLPQQDLACSSTCCHGMLVYGQENGHIRILDYKMNQIGFFETFKGPCQFVKFDEQGLLISVGEDFSIPTLKVWSISPTVNANLDLSLVWSCKLQLESSKTFPVTCIDLCPEKLVIGLENGTLLFFKGNLLKQQKMQILLEARTCITCLCLVNGGLVVGTWSGIELYDFFSRKSTQIDDQGCLSECIRVDPTFVSTESKSLIAVSALNVISKPIKSSVYVAQNDSIYLFHLDQSKPLSPVLTQKDATIKLIHAFADYLLIVSTRELDSPRESKSFKIAIYNLKLGYLAYSTTAQSVPQVEHFSSLILLFNDGAFIQLKRLDDKRTLDHLLEKKLFSLAIDLFKDRHVKLDQYQYDCLTEIYKRYGDYLYEKRDYSKAIEMYKKTIKKVPSSYVLMKFMDKLDEMMDYLQEIHHLKEASSNHSTILIHCYAKTRQLEKLDKFVESADYDVDQVSRILYTLPDQLLVLCKRFNKGSLYVSVLLQKGETNQVLDYILMLKSKSSFDELMLILKEEGSDLMKLFPQELTEIAILLLSSGALKDPGELSHMFIHYDDNGVQFYEKAVEYFPNRSFTHTLIEFYLATKNPLVLKLLSCSDYDPYQALVLLRKYSEKAGMLIVYEKNGLYEQILEDAIENGDYLKITNCCRKYNHKTIWKDALQYLCRSNHINLMDFLNELEAWGIFSDLEILSYASEDTGLSLGSIKTYFIQKASIMKEKIEKNQKLLQMYSQETTELEQKISDLSCKPIIFQSTHCAFCKGELEPPSVHYLCKHSFHSRCGGNVCPICSTEFDMLADLTSESNPEMMKNILVQELQKCKKEEISERISEFYSKNII